MLAAEKARQLAREGFETLLVCFNQPLARLLAEETAEVARSTGHLTVSTFHQLCEDLARKAGMLPTKPNPVTREWFDETLPDALDEAVEELGPTFHAIVIDEGQDFDADWLVSLEALLFDPKDDVLYVFHDPAQAIYRDDVVETLGLTTFELDENCRNPGPIHDFAMGHAPDAPETVPLREEGRAVELIEAEPGQPTLEALRKVLHRLRVEEQVRPWEIAVLVGGSLEESAVWRERTVRQRGAVERPGRRRGSDARARGVGGAGAAVRRDPVRLDPAVQGPREAGDRPGRAEGGRSEAGAAAVRRREPGAAAPRSILVAARHHQLAVVRAGTEREAALGWSDSSVFGCAIRGPLHRHRHPDRTRPGQPRSPVRHSWARFRNRRRSHSRQRPP